MNCARVRLPFVTFAGQLGVFESPERLLEQIGDASGLQMRVDCDGGNAPAALKIFEALRGRVDVATVGRAYSSGALLPMAARRIRIEPGGRMMLHPPRVSLFGTRSELLCEADRLAAVADRFVEIIAARSGTKRRIVRRWMSGPDKWFTAEECLSYGLADEIAEPQASDVDAALGIDSGEIATPSENEALLIDILRAFGTVRPADPERLRRDVISFAVNFIR